nr:immunoglobulin light chain junction region [Macaca mulatta]MOW72968.1 immunoglobulin light chain junction region [Macaca mulatta]MOW73098.1 immunoglobulin light chain junction region [Macaca mulatta]MOW73209.1 immunoglobulin light chain junction region [Macaca mulatta]MOW73297.1 immunoglobulin light chain junction region [Macaca mulatta]
CLQYANTPRTF